jgi:hypothetical protein
MADAEDLLKGRLAFQALRMWMDRYTQFVATKHAMHETLRSAFTSRSGPPIDTRAKIRTAIARFLAAGVADGTIRNDVGEDDLTVSLAATVLATNLAVDQDQLRRILDLLMDGLRPRAETPIAVEQLKRPVDETAIPRLSKRKSRAPGKRSQRR